VPRPHTTMRKIRDVLRLRLDDQLSLRQVSLSLAMPHTTVADYVRRARDAGLVSWPLPEELSDDDALETRLFGSMEPAPRTRAQPDFAKMKTELAKKAMTKALLWVEYREEHPGGYEYSQFCQLYRDWRKTLDVTMRQDHKAGEKLFVDFPGLRIPIYDARDLTVSFEAELFVAVLGASSYLYAEALRSQELVHWCHAHENAFSFYGGCPEMCVYEYVPWNIFVGDLGGHGAEELEARVVGGLKRLGALVRERGDVKGVRVRQAHDRECRLHLLPSDLDDRLAEVELRLTRGLGEGNEYLAVLVAPLRDDRADLAHRRGAAEFVTQALEDPLGRVTLLLRGALVDEEDLVDRREERSQLRARPRGRHLVARGLHVGQHLGQRVGTDLVVPANLALRNLLDEHLVANIRPSFHVLMHPSPVLLASRASLSTGLSGVAAFDQRFRGSVLLFSTSVHTTEPERSSPHDARLHDTIGAIRGASCTDQLKPPSTPASPIRHCSRRSGPDEFRRPVKVRERERERLPSKRVAQMSACRSWSDVRGRQRQTTTIEVDQLSGTSHYESHSHFKNMTDAPVVGA
jgi:transposase